MAKNTDNKSKKIHEFSIPVHRSIIRRDLWLGIPFIPLMLLIFISIIVILGAEQFAFIAVTIIVWFVLRSMTKKDEWQLDIMLSALLQPDEFR